MRANEFITEDLRQALQFATDAHKGQKRSGGEPYIGHPVRVAQTIEQYKKSHNIDALIAAAYLHDTIEDTDTTHQALHDLFGGLVASLVLELTSDKEKIAKLGKSEYLAKKMAHDMSSYALVIKLADRLDNVQDIATAKSPAWRARYKAETEHILDYIEKNRVLSGTHQKLVGMIRDKLNEIPVENVNEEAKAVKYNGLVLKYAFNDGALIMKAFESGSPIAYVKFVREGKELYPQDLWVNDDYRNRGIAKSMYDYLKSAGYVINRSHDQTKAGTGFWDKHRGEDAYVWEEEVLDEMPLPADWDRTQYGPGTSFKQRLAYALERAKKIGTGSSRVATTIEYEGRPTVLKIAKNTKGLAQNSVEASILEDGYASQLGILIPLIDYDEQNREPVWIHTELAQKATEKQLSNLMGVDSLNDLVQLANAIAGKAKMYNYQQLIDYMAKKGKTEQQIETATDYANMLVDLNNSFDVELGDLNRKANWGLYKGKPVILDVGFNSNVLNQYYSR